MQTDQDVFDGLPVRQWRLLEATINTAEEDMTATDGQAHQPGEAHGDPLLEVKMPKGSELYAPWCQKLLRAARAGRVYGRSHENASGKGDGDKENTSQTNGGTDEKPGDDENGPRGQKRDAVHAVVAMRWAQVPRSQEAPDRELLAKRRKGLAPMHAIGVAAGTVNLRKTKVKRADAEGRITVWEVMVPEGQTVEGEIVQEEAAAVEVAGAEVAAPKPGTFVEGLGVANDDGVVIASEGVTPLRKKGPVAKRKKKGPGKWQKKLAETDGMGVSASAEALEARRIKAQQAADGVLVDNDREDVEMGDNHDEDGEDDEDGEEGEDDREEGELSPSPEPESASLIPTATDQPTEAIGPLESTAEAVQIPLPPVDAQDTTPMTGDETAPIKEILATEPMEDVVVDESNSTVIDPPADPAIALPADQSMETVEPEGGVKATSELEAPPELAEEPISVETHEEPSTITDDVPNPATSAFQRPSPPFNNEEETETKPQGDISQDDRPPEQPFIPGLGQAEPLQKTPEPAPATTPVKSTPAPPTEPEPLATDEIAEPTAPPEQSLQNAKETETKPRIKAAKPARPDDGAAPATPQSPQRPEMEALTPTPSPPAGSEVERSAKDAYFPDGEVNLLATAEQERVERDGPTVVDASKQPE